MPKQKTHSSKPKPVKCISYEYPGIATELVVLCAISNPQMRTQNNTQKAWTLWDSGSTHSCISKKLINDLGLIAHGKPVETRSMGSTNPNTLKYIANLLILNKEHETVIEFSDVTFYEADQEEFNHDIVLGMDIIERGDFAITNVNQKTVLSFRTPSVKTIDFEKDIIQGRNSPCACNSGEKYKNCCGK